MILMEIAAFKEFIKEAIKEVITQAEKNHRVYKLDDLLAELDEN